MLSPTVLVLETPGDTPQVILGEQVTPISTDDGPAVDENANIDIGVGPDDQANPDDVTVMDGSGEQTDRVDGTLVSLTQTHDGKTEAQQFGLKTNAEGDIVLTQDIGVTVAQDPVGQFNVGGGAIYAAIGFGIVFLVLLMLNVFIRIQSAAVRAVESATSKPKAAPAPAAAPAAAPASDGKPAIPPGMKVADGSLGDVKLYDVDDATAAMIMAIVANQLDAPLNELYFKSIKEIKK